MKRLIGEGGVGELRWLSFILALRGAYGPNPLFEVFHIRRRKVYKLEVDVKLVSAPLRTFVVGNDIGLDLPSRHAAGGGYLDHQNRFPGRVVIQKKMMAPDEELVGLQTGPFNGNRGKAASDSIGAGPMANRIPNVKIHFGINRISGITPALLVEDLFQGLHRLALDWGKNLTCRFKVPLRFIDPEYRIPSHLGQYNKVPPSLLRFPFLLKSKLVARCKGAAWEKHRPFHCGFRIADFGFLRVLFSIRMPQSR
jgi:hypothetical protein